MKKTICFLLIAALALSLTGCSAGALTPAATEPPASAAPGTAAPAGTPEETAGPKETGEPEGRLVVSFSTEAEDFTADDGEQQLLNFSCSAPTVSISGRESAAASINAALEKERELFVRGEPEKDGLTGKVIHQLSVEGKIEASPAVYNDMLVIGTTGKDTSFIYGIRIQ